MKRTRDKIRDGIIFTAYTLMSALTGYHTISLFMGKSYSPTIIIGGIFYLLLGYYEANQIWKEWVSKIFKDV